MPSDTNAVRPGEELDIAALACWLREQIPGAGSAIEIEQFPDGHSNLVYLIRTGNHEYVLRRPPLGPVAPKAHDMAREFHVLKAVHPHFPEAPQVMLLCEDTSVIGTTFFVMERRHGIVLRSAVPAEHDSIPDYPRLVSEAFISCLVRLHNVEISGPDLSSLGKPEGFIERQVHGWSSRWAGAKTEELAEMDRVITWLNSRLPPSPSATLVHNDFKLDNIMLTPPGDKVAAVLDWEMATLGDPLADLGLALCYWTVPPAFTTLPGWFTRDELVESYASRTGRDVTYIEYYEVFGIFKLAVILQQIYFRFHRGQTSDERFRDLNQRVRGLVQLASEMVERQLCTYR